MNVQSHQHNLRNGLRIFARGFAELLAVIALVFALTQPVVAQFSAEIGIVCGEDGVEIAGAVQDQDDPANHQSCDDCLHCMIGLDRSAIEFSSVIELPSFPAISSLTVGRESDAVLPAYLHYIRSRGPPLFEEKPLMQRLQASSFMGVFS